MAQSEKKYLSTSKHYLSQTIWRFLRHVIPLKLWNFLYSIRQKLILKKLTSLISELAVNNIPKKVTPFLKNNISLQLSSNDDLIHKEIESLGLLFEKFESDKSILHNYNYLYGVLFNRIKDKANDVLEIGTYKGASLRAWKSYFPIANIYGIDIDPDTLFEEDRIFTTLADQLNRDSLSTVKNRWNQGYDVIIDDGWHQPEASVFTMLEFIPQLKENGIYVLEDIDQKKYQNFYEDIAGIFNHQGFYAEYIDLPKFVPPTHSNYKYGVLIIQKPEI